MVSFKKYYVPILCTVSYKFFIVHRQIFTLFFLSRSIIIVFIFLSQIIFRVKTYCLLLNKHNVQIFFILYVPIKV